MDVIVAGLGIMGSAAAHALAARGDRVIGFDAHPQGHALGSSHGPTRIIRHAMEESPAYLPIVADAFERWHALEEESGQQLLTLCGCLRFGPPGTPLLELFRASAAAGGLPFEELSAAEVAERFPGFRLPDHYVGLFLICGFAAFFAINLIFMYPVGAADVFDQMWPLPDTKGELR